MALTDHIGTLVAGSFDRPQINKLKPNAPAQYYAVVAFDPSVGPDLAAAMAEKAPGGNWQGLQHSIKPNKQLPKPYAGIPDDAIIVRFSTQYPVEIYDLHGQLVPASADNSAHIRAELYTGQRVRINGAPYAWNFQGKSGLSWNLYGVMAVGGGERRAAAGGSFDKYLPAQQAGVDQQAAGAAMAAAVSNTNPFGQQQASAPAQQAAPANNANPFQQSAPAGGVSTNPFG